MWVLKCPRSIAMIRGYDENEENFLIIFQIPMIRQKIFHQHNSELFFNLQACQLQFLWKCSSLCLACLSSTCQGRGWRKPIRWMIEAKKEKKFLIFMNKQKQRRSFVSVSHPIPTLTGEMLLPKLPLFSRNSREARRRNGGWQMKKKWAKIVSHESKSLNHLSWRLQCNLFIYALVCVFHKR